MKTPDPIAEVFAQNPDHPLVKVLRDWNEKARNPEWCDTWDDMELDHIAVSNALDDVLPAPTFGEQVLAHLPEGWEAWPDLGNQGGWTFDAGSGSDPVFYRIPQSSSPKAVAEALMLLAGEA